MKIQQLLEAPIETKVTGIESKNKFKSGKDNLTKDRLGKSGRAGFYGRVHDNGDPHMVEKIPFHAAPQGHDGYYAYIKYLVDNKVYDSNPYAPRVYKLKTIKDASNNMKYKAQLERLQPFTSLGKDIVIGLGEMLFGEDIFQNELEKWVWMSGERYAVIAFTKMLTKICNGKIESSDPKLNELCHIIKSICDSVEGFDIDIHSGNVMWRLSPHPQLVIVDPIAE